MSSDDLFSLDLGFDGPEQPFGRHDLNRPQGSFHFRPQEPSGLQATGSALQAPPPSAQQQKQQQQQQQQQQSWIQTSPLVSPVSGAVPGEARDIALRQALLEYSRRLPGDTQHHPRAAPVRPVDAPVPSLPPQSPQVVGRRIPESLGAAAGAGAAGEGLATPDIVARSIPYLRPVQLDYRGFRSGSAEDQTRAKVPGPSAFAAGPPRPPLPPGGIDISPSRTLLAAGLSGLSPRSRAHAEEEAELLRRNREQFRAIIDRVFDRSARVPRQVDQFEFLALTTELCGLPEYCNLALFLCVLRYDRIRTLRLTQVRKQDPLPGDVPPSDHGPAVVAGASVSAATTVSGLPRERAEEIRARSRADSHPSETLSDASDAPTDDGVLGGLGSRDSSRPVAGSNIVGQSPSPPVISVLSPHLTPRARLLAADFRPQQAASASFGNCPEDPWLAQPAVRSPTSDSSPGGTGGSSSSSSNSSSGARFRRLLETAATPTSSARILTSGGLPQQPPISPPAAFSPNPLDSDAPAFGISAEASAFLEQTAQRLAGGGGILSSLLSHDTALQGFTAPVPSSPVATVPPALAAPAVVAVPAPAANEIPTAADLVHTPMQIVAGHVGDYDDDDGDDGDGDDDAAKPGGEEDPFLAPPTLISPPAAGARPGLQQRRAPPVAAKLSTPSPALRSRTLEQKDAAAEILEGLLDPVDAELSEVEELQWTEQQLQTGAVKKEVFMEFFSQKLEPLVHQLWSHGRRKSPKELAKGARLDGKRRLPRRPGARDSSPVVVHRRPKRGRHGLQQVERTGGRRNLSTSSSDEEDDAARLLSLAADSAGLPASADPGETASNVPEDPVTHKLLASSMLFLILCHDRNGRVLQRTDFQPVLQQVITQHPSLRFLSATPEFQSVYAQTVVSRIFYALDTTGDNTVTLPELQRSDILETLYLLETELDDINRIYDYFSYQHFYVIYCEFWSLDADHDGLVSHDDLLRYEEGSLSERLIDRVLEGGGRPLLSGQPGKFCYEDFVSFFLAEMDKTNDSALLYWSRVIDLDGDGVLSAWELEYFYSEQRRRLKEAGVMEDPLTGCPPTFADILCQLTDMVHPECLRRKRGPGAISADPFVVSFTRMDLRRSRMAPAFFNILFNLNKFLLLESTHSAEARNRIATPHLSDWDRFARAAYEALT